MTPLDHALAYAALGWRVIPIKPGHKHPFGIADWQTKATTDEARIRRHWAKHPLDGIGIACGPGSGLVAIDIDPRHGGDESWAMLEAKYGAAPETVEAVTGRNGRHLVYRHPTDGGPVITNAAHAMPPGIDVRGDGGQIVVAPSIHPISGQAYAWEVAHDPLDGFRVAEMPSWLLALLRTPQPEQEARRDAPTYVGADSIIERFTADHTWPELLEARGWTFHSRRCNHLTGEIYELWTRPGKSVREGASASLYYGGTDVLKVFTSSAAPLEQDATYTRFGFWTAYEHNGDHKAASGAYRRVLNGTAPRVAVVTPAGDPEEPWPDPIPVAGVAKDLPTFPVEVFPAWIGDHVAQVARELQVPIDLPATLAIIALSTCAAKRAEVWLTRSWREQLCLYTVVALPPGAGKSPAFSLMHAPLVELEAQMVAAAAPKIDEATTRRAIIEKSQRKAIDKGETAEALMLGDELRAMPVPVEPRLFVDDVTVEKLGEMMRDQGGRLALTSTEGGLFDQMIGRYSEKTKASLDPYLMMWSGDTVRVDRIGRGSIVIDKPALTIGVTVQPSVLEQLRDRPELRGRGLTARFMYSMPATNVGFRDMGADVVLDDDVLHRYGATMGDLWHTLASYAAPLRLEITAEAKRRYTDWRQELEVERRPGGSLVPLVEWSTKVESSVARMSGLLHLAHGKGSAPVDDEDIAAAIEVGGYWIAHAHAVHEMWGTDGVTSAAAKVLEWIGRESVTEFSLRDAYSANRGAMPRADDAIEPLGLLVERGWIRPMFEGPLRVGIRGVASPRYAVHPDFSSHDRNNHARMRVMCIETQKRSISLSFSKSQNATPPAHDAHDAHEADLGAETQVVTESDEIDPTF